MFECQFINCGIDLIRSAGSCMYWSRRVTDLQMRVRNNSKSKSDRVAGSEFMLSALIYKQKSCEVCRKKHNEASMVLCDRCEDAFHTRCIGLQDVPTGMWVCRLCCADIARLKQDQLMRKRPVQKGVQQECAGCRERIGHQYYDYKIEEIKVQARLISKVTCASCHQKFHSICFSQRPTGINCSTCEESIRQAIPKGHSQFLRFVKDSRARVAELNYLELTEGLESEQNRIECNALPFMGLTAPPKPKDWRIIACYEASLCYALMTRGMTYCQNLVLQMQPDRIETIIRGHRESVEKIHRLHRTDETAYEDFKRQAQLGWLPPLQVREDRKKGFYLAATDNIPPNMILAEYTGELITARDSLNMLSNDSIFTLIRNPRSSDSLDIAPGKFAHLAIFISGINNSQEQAADLQNVKALKFAYKGIARLIFCSLKDIAPNQTLYLNYNGDKAICEYPTASFVH